MVGRQYLAQCSTQQFSDGNALRFSFFFGQGVLAFVKTDLGANHVINNVLHDNIF